jgi:hypothetical protein
LLRATTAHGTAAVEHGYAITGHASQGLTTDRAFVFAGLGSTREWLYTAMTRGRQNNNLYTAGEGRRARLEFAPGEQSATDARARLVRAIESPGVHKLALDAAGENRRPSELTMRLQIELLSAHKQHETSRIVGPGGLGR